MWPKLELKPEARHLSAAATLLQRDGGVRAAWGAGEPLPQHLPEETGPGLTVRERALYPGNWQPVTGIPKPCFSLSTLMLMEP